MNTNFQIIIEFLTQKQNEIFSSPRALFGKGEEELFIIISTDAKTGVITLKPENNQAVEIDLRLLEEAILLLEDKNIVSVSRENSPENSLSMEEHLSLWQSGTDNKKLDIKIVPYITDLIVLSGIAAYGWAKSGTEEKFAAVALKEKHKTKIQKEEVPKEKEPALKENKDILETKITDKIPAQKPVKKQRGPVLITYTTKYGSTAEIAWSIRNSFQDDGIATEVKRIQDVDDVRKYKLVIIGSPIYDNRLLPEAVEFVKLHKNWLSKRMTALFVVGISLKDKNDETVLNMAKVYDEVERNISLSDVGMFSGRLDAENLPLMRRLNTMLNKEKTGDFRDWREIGEWADRLKKLFILKNP
ncbi:MAG: flavodoxin domain-containing protein [Methanomicrobium sp.]|nr:flavodoxin domain-containing protein [Methanomicrobium sp.]MDD4299068.1 flavodoxin domain-containing protein [Methanomicrobium sp.]